MEKILSRPQVHTKGRRELLPDLNFARGFNVSLFHSNSSAGRLAGVLDHGGSAQGEPVWQIAQWGCTHDLSKAVCKREGNIVCYDDGAKRVTVDTSKTGCATLLIKGSEEYGKDGNGRVRDRVGEKENWPHLLLEQTQVNAFLSSQAKHLYMHMEYEITSCISLVDRAVYPENIFMHAGMFVWFLHLTNCNPKTESYGEAMWFGVKPFDTRFLGKTPAAEKGYDHGKEDSTGLLIYIPCLEEVALQEGSRVSVPSANVGKRQEIYFDALPFLKKALAEAESLGAMKGANVHDLRIDSTNFGWELMGNNDAVARIYHVNLYEEV